jgi:hypothetical protein
VPYLTDVVLDPATCEIRENGDVDSTGARLLFEPTDRDVLMAEHPGAAQKILFTAFGMSGIGEEAREVAKGNS